MSFVLYRVLSAALLLLFFACMFIGLFCFISGLIRDRNRWILYRVQNFFKKSSIPPFLLYVLRVKQAGEKIEAKQQLLDGSGWGWNAVHYAVVKRLLVLFLVFAALILWKFGQTSRISQIQYLYLWIAIFVPALALYMDKQILELVKKYRSRRIVAEIYGLSKQLLYYSGSNMNLHSKLVRCIPHTKEIRQALYLLTNEWYQDPGLAMERFKRRIGTEDGHHFAETVNSMRLYEHENYYELLKRRTRDYKEKLDLIREEKKESASYILFVLAGIPILNTFRLFLYPWIAEGHKLFDSLG